VLEECACYITKGNLSDRFAASSPDKGANSNRAS